MMREGNENTVTTAGFEQVYFPVVWDGRSGGGRGMETR